MAGRGKPRGNEGNPPVSDVIERTRVYRTPIKPTPNSYQEIVPAKRAGPGLRGEPFPLKVNWFNIKQRKYEVYIYETIVEKVNKTKYGVKVERINDPIRIPTIVYPSIYHYREVFINPKRVFFDELEYLYTPDLLRMNNQELTLHAKDGKTRIRIKPYKKFTFNLSPGEENIEQLQWSSILTKLVLSRRARAIPADQGSIEARFAHFGAGMFFIPKTLSRNNTTVKRNIQPGVEAWMGFYVQCRIKEDGDPVINFGLCNRFFMSLELNLIEFYLAILKDRGYEVVITKDTVMSPQAVDDFTERLSGLKFKCEWVPLKDRNGFVSDRGTVHAKFIRVMQPHECADNYYLDVFDPVQQKRMTRRMDYWYADMKRPLLYPKLPLCEVKTGKRMYYLPMEVLFTHDKPQKFTKQLDRVARMKLPEILRRTPEEHHRLTSEMVSKKMEYEKDPFMEAMEMSLDPEMVEVEGRVLKKTPIITKDECGEKIAKIVMNPETGEFDVKGAYEIPEKEVIFVKCRVTDRIKENDIKSFSHGLIEKCRSRGMKISKEDIYKEVPENAIASAIEDELMFLEGRKRMDHEILVFLFFVGNLDEDLYGEIKLISDLHRCVVTQVVAERTVTKMLSKVQNDVSDHKTIFHNIWLKLNVKLGGVNQIVDFSDSTEPEFGRLPSHERTMFIGIDAIHPSPRAPVRSFSLAAIVASIDRNATKYADRIMVNRNCNETISHFEDHFAYLLMEYHSARGFLPDRVVILRDGVSDSEMIVAASRELQSIKGAWKRCANGVPLAKFTYIVAQKRHLTRFYRRDVDAEKNNTNPFPGTVVTQGIVSPHKFDFYMISHYTLKGTSRPIHYTVVVDESTFSTDEITEMCFRLCCLYARCSKPVSIPTPVYYAHLRCKRAAVQFQSAVRTCTDGSIAEIEDMRSNEDELKYSDRVERQARKIENLLNRDFNAPKKYPGMAFV